MVGAQPFDTGEALRSRHARVWVAAAAVICLLGGVGAGWAVYRRLATPPMPG